MASSDEEGAGRRAVVNRHRLELKAFETRRKKEVAVAGKVKDGKKAAQLRLAGEEQEILARHRQEVAKAEGKEVAKVAKVADGEDGDISPTGRATAAGQQDEHAAKAVDEASGNQDAFYGAAKVLTKSERKRQAREQQRDEAQARLRAELGDGNEAAAAEAVAIDERLAQEGLRVHQVASDGHCLFRAVAFGTPSHSHGALRVAAADRMLTNRVEYEPFLDLEAADVPDFMAYVDMMKNTPAWGGEMELRALAEVIQRPIVVTAAMTAHDTTYGGNFKAEKPVRVSYHKLLLATGAHYNGVTAANV